MCGRVGLVLTSKRVEKNEIFGHLGQFLRKSIKRLVSVKGDNLLNVSWTIPTAQLSEMFEICFKRSNGNNLHANKILPFQ